MCGQSTKPPAPTATPIAGNDGNRVIVAAFTEPGSALYFLALRGVAPRCAEASINPVWDLSRRYTGNIEDSLVSKGVALQMTSMCTDNSAGWQIIHTNKIMSRIERKMLQSRRNGFDTAFALAGALTPLGRRPAGTNKNQLRKVIASTPQCFYGVPYGRCNGGLRICYCCRAFGRHDAPA